MSTVIKFVSFFLIILCFASTTQVVAKGSKDGKSETIFNKYEVVGNKIYIQTDQLYLTNSSILIFLQDEQFRTQQLNCDENGIYCLAEHLDKIIDKCYNGHKIWCIRCGGCVVRECLFHCKCVEWYRR